jgi:hypothetical protein
MIYLDYPFIDIGGTANFISNQYYSNVNSEFGPIFNKNCSIALHKIQIQSNSAVR